MQSYVRYQFKMSKSKNGWEKLAQDHFAPAKTETLLSLSSLISYIIATELLFQYFFFFLIGFSSPKLAISFAQFCTNQNVTISRKGRFYTVMGPALGFLFR